MTASVLQPGDEAPPFRLTATQGGHIALADYHGKRHVILYFYPKDDTPGCTREACGFRDTYEKIKLAGGVVLGVSLDPLASHVKFSKKYELPFPLLCDTDASLSKAYGAYQLKNMYGKKSWGIVRSTFIIDRLGRIVRIFRRVRVEAHVDEVLKVLEELNA